MTGTIGIVGGAGPMAGALLTKKIVRICQQRYRCFNDYDYPKLIMLSYPFAEMLKPDSDDQKEEEVSRQLCESVAFLVDSGCDTIGIACNTLHTFLSDSADNSKIMNLIEITQKAISEQNLSKILTLCTKTSADSQLYYSSSILLPENKDQELVDMLIAKVLEGDYCFNDSKILKRFIHSKLKDDPKIDGILLGCTELSVLVDDYPIEFQQKKVINPLEILASHLCANCLR